VTEQEWQNSGELPRLLRHAGASGRKWRLFNCACCRRLWLPHQRLRERELKEGDEVQGIPELNSPEVLPQIPATDALSPRVIEATELWADGLVTQASLEADRAVLSQAAQAALRYLRQVKASMRRETRATVWEAYRAELAGGGSHDRDRALNAANDAWHRTRAKYRVVLCKAFVEYHKLQAEWAATRMNGMSAGEAQLVARAMLHLDCAERKPEDRKREKRAQCDLVRCIFGNPFRPVSFDPEWRSRNAVAVATAIYQDRTFDIVPILGDTLAEAGCMEEAILGHCHGPGPHVRGCWVVDLVLGRK
jgi:hypothetical protein